VLKIRKVSTSTHTLTAIRSRTRILPEWQSSNTAEVVWQLSRYRIAFLAGTANSSKQSRAQGVPATAMLVAVLIGF
jgi:hypothetical protein